MADDLEKLINEGPDPHRGLTALVLSRFHEIQLARQYARPWAKIADALHLPHGKTKALSAAFWRVSRGSRGRAAQGAAAGDDPDHGYQPGAGTRSRPVQEDRNRPTD